MSENGRYSVKLSSILVASKDGDWGAGEPRVGLKAYRVIRGADFPSARLNKVDDIPTRYLDPRTASRRTLEPGDIIIETAGGSRDRSTGRTLLVTKALLQNLSLQTTCASFARFLRIDSDQAESRYVYWYLQYLHQSGGMWKHQVQHTGVARFQFTRFASEHDIPIPPRSEQQAIAEMLGALDDKVAANDQLLHDGFMLAKAMYEQTVQRAPLLRVIGDVLDLKYGKALPSHQRTSGKVAVYGSGGVVGLHTESLVSGPGVVIGRKGTVGTVHWTEGDFFPIDTTFYAVPQIGIPMEFVYFMLRTLGLDAMNSDSAVPGLNRSDVLTLPIRLPDESAVRRFQRLVRPIFALRNAAESESVQLTGLRDVLLPKLMSGDIRVREAEKIVEDAT